MEAVARPGQLRTTTTIDRISLSGDEEEVEEETEEEAEEEDVDSQDVVPQTLTEDAVTQSSREAPSPESVETVTHSTTVLDLGSENQTNGTRTCTGPENKEPSDIAQVTDFEDSNKNTESAPPVAAPLPPAGFPSVNLENIPEGPKETVSVQPEVVAAVPTASRKAKKQRRR